MAYIGNKPGSKYATLTRQTFSTPTGTSHTLSNTVTNSDDLLLYINNVKQNPADYTASGTTLTTASLAGGTEMYCLYYGKTTETVAVPASSVGDSHMVDMAASKLTGTIADARFPATLPASSGVNLTALNASNIASGTVASARLPSLGKVLQVLSTTKTDVFSSTGAETFNDITDLSIAITPVATSSKILVCWNVALSTSAINNNVYIRIVRDSTAISIGDAVGSRQRTSGGGFHHDAAGITTVAGTYLDSPSTTSATTYKPQIGSQGSITKYVNRGGWDNDVDYAIGRTASTITVMEIGA